MTLADAIQASYAAWERKPADFYPTPPDVTQSLLDMLKLPAGARVLEPCCGEGHISYVLRANGHRDTSWDIRDTGFQAWQGDYLSAHGGQGFDAVITNPPFSLAAQFVRKALSDAPVVAMLLKSSYWHAKKRIPLFEEHPPRAVCALTWRPAFLEEERGSSPLMDCVWVVWTQEKVAEPSYRLLRRPERFPELPPPTLSIRLARLREAMAENRAARGL